MKITTEEMKKKKKKDHVNIKKKDLFKKKKKKKMKNNMEHEKKEKNKKFSNGVFKKENRRKDNDKKKKKNKNIKSYNNNNYKKGDDNNNHSKRKQFHKSKYNNVDGNNEFNSYEEKDDDENSSYIYNNESDNIIDNEENINNDDDKKILTTDIEITNNNKMDYVKYINMIKNEQNENEKKVNDEEDINENNILNKINNDHKDSHSNNDIYKIVLLFSPLALTSIKNKQKTCIINADDHMNMFMNKLENLENAIKFEKKEKEKRKLEQIIQSVKNKLENIRLDILFFTLLSLRDSILNKKGKLQIYIYTVNGSFIFVSPLFRVPRNFTLFKKVMLNLLKRGVVYDDQKNVLLKIIFNDITSYVEDSVCIAISNKGFPTDVKKLTDKIKQTKNNYFFFISLSNSHDVTKFMDIIKKEKTKTFSYDYLVRLSDLQLSAVALTSKLTHFLN
ncbi:small subunit rRNA processing factor, putative [Plasmodium sp. gorilla clade G1]|nr:small subunit rRNA processing factor, putative [Plasmodium sp. gorilla clade G1]